MKRAALLGCLMIVLFAAFVGCRTAPIASIQDEKLWTDGATSLADAAEAIWRTGRKVGWNIESVAPGELRGTLHMRMHVAVVQITHDESHFSIRYESSENLLQSGNLIHRNFNAWLRSLADQIEREPVRCCASLTQGERAP